MDALLELGGQLLEQLAAGAGDGNGGALGVKRAGNRPCRCRRWRR